MPSGPEWIILFVLALPFIIVGLVLWTSSRKRRARRVEANTPPTPPTPGEAE